MEFDVNNLNIPFYPFAAGLATVVIIGLGVRWLICFWTDQHKPKHEPFSPPVETAGSAIGLLERILFYVSFVIGSPVFIGAWLAFKVAAKWEAWGSLIKLPGIEEQTKGHASESDDSKESYIGDFRERWQLSTWLNSKFLLGTLLNIAVAGVGAWVFAFVSSYLAVS